MGWDGSTCPTAYHTAFSIEPSTGRTYIDLMKVDRVVLQRAQYPDAGNQAPPPGWKWVDYPGHERYIWVLEREDGLISTHPGPADTRDVTYTQIARDSVSSHLRVTSGQGGHMVFARLAWPGYRVTLNGRDIGFHTVANTFLAVDIPPGTHYADLVVSWRPPGWKIGIATALVGLLGLGLLQWFYRRDQKSPSEPTEKRPTSTPELESNTAAPAFA